MTDLDDGQWVASRSGIVVGVNVEGESFVVTVAHDGEDSRVVLPDSTAPRELPRIGDDVRVSLEWADD